MPLVQDVVAHTFFKHQHVATVHQQDGGSHVKDEIGKLADKSSTDETSTGAKAFDSVPLHVAVLLLFQFSPVKLSVISHYSHYCSGLASLPLAIQLPPPRV